MDLPEALVILGLDGCATSDDIRRAYRKAAVKAHPDSGGSHEAILRVNEAMHVLRRRGLAA
jgi:DnaJ family protein C protein 3